MSTKNQNAFSGFKFEKPVVETLKEGNHSVRINSYSVTDSFHLLDGSVKDGIAEEIESEEKWSDSTPQLAVVFVGPDGVMTYRFNAKGYKHTEDFTAEELEDDKYTVIGDYVCVRDKNKNLVRIESPQRTQKAQRLLNQFLFATGAEEGADLFDILDNCISEKSEIDIVVKKKQYDERDVFDIAKFAPANALVETSEGLEDDEF